MKSEIKKQCKEVNLEFRSIKNTDYDGCARSLMATFGEPPWNERWTYEQAHTRINEMMAGTMSRGFIVLDGDKIIATCIGRIMTYISMKELWIDEFSVNPTHQGQSIGSRLITFVRGELKKEGVNHLALTTHRDYPSVRFYEKNGFKVSKSIVFMHD